MGERCGLMGSVVAVWRGWLSAFLLCDVVVGCGIACWEDVGESDGGGCRGRKGLGGCWGGRMVVEGCVKGRRLGCEGANLVGDAGGVGTDVGELCG